MKTTVLFFLISILLYGLLWHYLITFPKKVFVAMKRQLLQSVDYDNNERLARYLHPDDSPEENASHLWRYFQDRSLEILGRKKKFLSKTIFGGGGSIFAGWCLVSFFLFFSNDVGVINFIPSYFFWFILIAEIPILIFFYFWHLRNFPKYMIQGGQEKFLEDAKKHLDGTRFGGPKETPNV